jgi:hypothetical protein
MAKSGRNDARSGRIHARRWCGLASGAHEQGGGDEGKAADTMLDGKNGCLD